MKMGDPEQKTGERRLAMLVKPERDCLVQLHDRVAGRDVLRYRNEQARQHDERADAEEEHRAGIPSGTAIMPCHLILWCHMT
jgi:hypothetical protein